MIKKRKIKLSKVDVVYDDASLAKAFTMKQAREELARNYRENVGENSTPEFAKNLWLMNILEVIIVRVRSINFEEKIRNPIVEEIGNLSKNNIHDPKLGGLQVKLKQAKVKDSDYIGQGKRIEKLIKKLCKRA